MKKKIMFIMPNKGYSGAEKVVIQIIENLKNKYEFIYVSEPGEINQYLQDRNIRHIKTKKRLDKNEIEEIVKKEKPNILHTTDYRASTITSFINTKIPIISHLHNNPPWLKNLNKNSIVYLLASKKFKKILTVSNSIEREYIFSKLIKNKIENISNPISRREILDNISNNKTDKIYDICFVARLCKQKDPIRFVDIIEKIKDIIPNISVIMIGEGSLNEEVKQYIIEKKLSDTINLLGFKKNVYEYMNESKIFCLTSKWEGFGLVAFEALTLGMPTYVTPVGGLVDIVDNDCGYLCNTDEEFINEMISVLKDKKKYQITSNKAIEKSKKLDNIEEYMSKLGKIYQDLMSN